MYNFSWFFLLFVQFSWADIIFSDFTTERDQCKEICADSFFLLPKVKESTLTCQRGCRFFNIIYLKDDHDVNITKDECFMSCKEAYVTKELRESCNIGCNTMSKKKQNELANVLVFIEQDNPKNFIIAEPELEVLEFELLSDPNIQSQLDFGYNVEYKIPETRIRTMPIEQMIDYNQKQNTGDWLDCASRNSGIPRLILLVAITAAVLIALWLSFSTDKRAENDMDDDENLIKEDLVSEEKNYMDYIEKVPLEDDDGIEFSEPSKYAQEDQKV